MDAKSNAEMQRPFNQQKNNHERSHYGKAMTHHKLAWLQIPVVKVVAYITILLTFSCAAGFDLSKLYSLKYSVSTYSNNQRICCHWYYTISLIQKIWTQGTNWASKQPGSSHVFDTNKSVMVLYITQVLDTKKKLFIRVSYTKWIYDVLISFSPLWTNELFRFH